MGGCLSEPQNTEKSSKTNVMTVPIQPNQAQTSTSIGMPVQSQPQAKGTSTDLSKDHPDQKVQGYREALQHQVIGNVRDLPNSLYRQEKEVFSTAKFTRLSKQISKFSQFLPCQPSNSIFVRIDQTRLNSMNVLISGSAGTPYAHGLYHFQLYCDDSYPSLPPKMQLLTGKGKVRFNPNLYQNGYICLSLLGTWRGNLSESWNPLVSTLYQIFVSIQSLIMTEDVYFNEPGYQSLKGTSNGNLFNQGYSNVVKLANIRYAMIEIIKTPPKGFQKIVRKHFFLKKDDILADCQKWLSMKDRPFKNCSQNIRYQGLINTSGYGKLLEDEINDLKEVLMNLRDE